MREDEVTSGIKSPQTKNLRSISCAIVQSVFDKITHFYTKQSRLPSKIFFGSLAFIGLLCFEPISHATNTNYLDALVVYQALGGDAVELEATADQVEALAQQAKLCDSSRIFRIADLLADMEDKLRHVLSVRTLIEMTLLKSSRVAKVATLEEVMRAVQALRAGLPSTLPPQACATARPVETPRASEPAGPVEPVRRNDSPGGVVKAEKKEDTPPPRRELSMEERREILDDSKLNDVILKKLPGSTVVDFR
jgi:DNA polymerase III gamma/tau subunit